MNKKIKKPKLATKILGFFKRLFATYEWRLPKIYVSTDSIDEIMQQIRKRITTVKNRNKTKDAQRIVLELIPLDATTRKITYRSKKQFLKKKVNGKPLGKKLYKYVIEKHVVATTYYGRSPQDTEDMLAELRTKLYNLDEGDVYKPFFGEGIKEREYVTDILTLHYTNATGKPV